MNFEPTKKELSLIGFALFYRITTLKELIKKDNKSNMHYHNMIKSDLAETIELKKKIEAEKSSG